MGIEMNLKELITQKKWAESQEYLKSRLHYDHESGLFTWLNSKSKSRKNGEVAGAARKSDGYVNICVDGAKFSAHRLAWLYVYGEIPKVIDHIDGVRSNNRISNLRMATHKQNAANSKLRKNNKSGYKGVFERGERFFVKFRYKECGVFDDPVSAAMHYDDLATKEYGEFAKTNKSMGLLSDIPDDFVRSERWKPEVKYIGVTWDKKLSKWRSQITSKGKRYHLGLFDSPIDAAISYDEKYEELNGRNGKTNKSTGLL